MEGFFHLYLPLLCMTEEYNVGKDRVLGLCSLLPKASRAISTSQVKSQLREINS